MEESRCIKLLREAVLEIEIMVHGDDLPEWLIEAKEFLKENDNDSDRN